MPVVPPYNAAPNAVPFLRWAEEQIMGLQQESARRAQNENNTNRGQSGTIDALQQQVQDLNSAQVELAGAYQAAATAEDLASVAADARVLPDVSTSSASGFTLTTGGITVTSSSITVPAGFTRALVLSTGFIGASVGTGFGQLTGVVVIDGNSGAEARGTTNDVHATVAPSHSRVLSGLSGSFSVSLTGRVLPGPSTTTSTAMLTIITLFLP